MFGEFTLFKHLAGKVWQMNRSAKGLLIVTTTLDGFGLVNRGQFTKFAKLSTHQTFPLYDIIYLDNLIMYNYITQDMATAIFFYLIQQIMACVCVMCVCLCVCVRVCSVCTVKPPLSRQSGTQGCS